MKRLKGRQVAAFAASGVDPTTGTALETLGDTAAMGEIDALQIRDNAEREAWRHENDAINARAQAGLFRLQGNNVVGASAAPILGAIGGIADRWYQYSLED